jgi:hypothetical protein
LAIPQLGACMKPLVLALVALPMTISLDDARADMSSANHGEATLLRGFALARCLGKAFPSIRADADAAAGGYVERGSSAFEAYEEIETLAAEFVERDYPSKTGSELSIMKCLDLLDSAELTVLIERHSAGRR